MRNTIKIKKILVFRLKDFKIQDYKTYFKLRVELVFSS